MRSRTYAAAIVLFAALFFAPELFGGRLAVTGNLSQWLPWAETATAEERDAPSVSLDCNLSYYPRREILHRAWRDGVIPFWNPYSFAGTPFLGDVQAGVLYPPNWILFPLDAGQQLGWFLFLHVAWAGAGVFVLARSRGVPAPVAVLAGCAWMLNGFFAKHYGQPTFLATVAWMPWILAAALSVLRRPAPDRAAALALAGAGAFLAGQPQLAALGAYAAVVVVGVARFTDAAQRPADAQRPAGGRRPADARVAGALVLAGVLAGLLVAAQLLPTRSLASMSARADLAYDTVVSGALHPVELLRFVVPEIFGSPLTGDEWSPLFPRGDGFYLRNQMNSLFAGTPVFLLALWGMIGPATRRAAAPFTVLFLVGALLAFGSPLARLAWEIVPGFRFSRIDRAGSLVVLAQIVPAALAAASLAESARRSRRVFAVVAGAALLALAAFVVAQAGSLPARLGADPSALPGGVLDTERSALVVQRTLIACGFGLAALAAFIAPGGRFVMRWPLALACVQLFLFASPYRLDRRPSEVFPPSPGVESLREVLEFRSPGGAGGGRFLRFARDMPLRPYPLSAVLPPSTNVPYALRDLQGYNALADRRLGDALEVAWGENVFSHGIWAGRRIVAPERTTSLEHPVLDALSVRAAVSATEFRAAGWSPVPARGLLLARNEEALPRVRFAHSGRGVPAGEMAALLRSGDLDPRGEVPWVGEGAIAAPPASAEPGTVQLVHDGWNALEIRAATPVEALLVVADSYSPGWRATVDGAETEILPVYGLVRGVVVPPGTHTVRLDYVPPGFRTGSALSLAGILLAGGFLALGAGRRRSP